MKAGAIQFSRRFRERVGRRRGRQIFGADYQRIGLKAEFRLNRSAYVGCEIRRPCAWARKHDVATLDVRLDAGEADRLQLRGQRLHRQLVLASDVNSSE